ncbi:MAG: LysR family transcriptional regulator [Saprospiraceae bacterium]|nr:LysR family transcriptional regulator [Saprospiraceae bacterium]
MNLQFIKYFITLAEYRNFTKAAEKNFVVQSTFSTGIKKLEEVLDCQLFYRDKRNVNLTKEGEQLLPKAKELLSLWNSIEISFREDQVKMLKVGILNTIHHTDIVVPILKNFRELYKAYQFELIEDTQASLLERLKKNELDVVFVQEEDLGTNIFSKRFVYEEKLEVLLPASHELHNKSKIKLSELDNLSFIKHGNCVLNHQVEEQFRERGLELNEIFTVQHSEMLISLVSSNMGISLMAKPQSHSNLITFVPIADAEFKRDIILVWKNNNESKALKCFLTV